MSTSICVVGTDEIMVSDRLHSVVLEQLGTRDPSIALEEFFVNDAAGSTENVVSSIIAALNTPAFLTDRRVVVVRDAHGLVADEVAQLMAWIEAPTPDTVLVMSVVGAKNAKLAKAAEQLIETNVGSGRKDRVAFAKTTFASFNVTVDAATIEQVVDLLGDEMNRLDQIARTLQQIYGSSPLKIMHVQPYLGEAGDVPSWDLTDAVGEGNVAKAITVARRMLDSRGKAALQIVASLSRYYLEIARLESGEATNDVEAGELLGKSKYPAGKQLQVANRLGSQRIAQALRWITESDLALKGGVSYGGKDLESDMDVTELTVIEVLVARLARLHQAAKRR